MLRGVGCAKCVKECRELEVLRRVECAKCEGIQSVGSAWRFRVLALLSYSFHI